MSALAGARRLGLLPAACALAAAAITAAAPACELRLSEPRSDRELARLPLDRHAPEVRVAFEHSVLGTTVIDRYRFLPHAVLVEEEFEGEGYGLPAAPGAGERLERVGPDGARQRLSLQRTVEPLVVRALPAQRMRLLHGQGAEIALAAFGTSAVRLQARGCPVLAASPSDLALSPTPP